MSAEVEKNIQAMRHLFDILNQQDFSGTISELWRFCTEDYILHDPSMPNLKPGLKYTVEFYEQFYKEIKDVHSTIEDIFGVGDKTVMRQTFEYTEIQTQERKKLTVIIISRWVNGKVAEEWQVIAPI